LRASRLLLLPLRLLVVLLLGGVKLAVARLAAALLVGARLAAVRLGWGRLTTVLLTNAGLTATIVWALLTNAILLLWLRLVADSTARGLALAVGRSWCYWATSWLSGGTSIDGATGANGGAAAAAAPTATAATTAAAVSWGLGDRNPGAGAACVAPRGWHGLRGRIFILAGVTASIICHDSAIGGSGVA
jgi:hypothetical protein